MSLARMKKRALTKQAVLKLAGETNQDPRTVQKWADGERVLSATRYALEAALERLEKAGQL